MPRQTSIDAAYSPVGGKQQVSFKCNNFCVSFLFTILVAFIFFIGTGTNTQPHHEFQSGQATMIYTPSDTSEENSNKLYRDKNLVEEDENIQIVLEEATEEIEDAEFAELAAENREIDTTTTKITNNLRIGIGKVFGSSLSNDEMEAVASQVQTQLKNEAHTQLRSKADLITKHAIAAIEEKVSDEENTNVDESLIEKGLLNDQKKAMRDIKVGMEADLDAVQNLLPSRAIEIEKAILEERLSMKLGKRVKLVIDDDNEISSAGTDDELFNGLSSITRITPTTSSSSSLLSSSLSGNSFGYTSSSSSTSSTNMYIPSTIPPSHTSPTQTSGTMSSSTHVSLAPEPTTVTFSKSKPITHSHTSTALDEYTSKVGTRNSASETATKLEYNTTVDIASISTKSKSNSKKKSIAHGGKN